MERNRFPSCRLLLPALTALLLLWCFLLTFAQSAVYAESATPDRPGSLTGIVANEAGTPLAGITVALFRNGNQEPIYTLQTDPQGRYHFKLLPAGLYYLKFSDPTAQYAFQFYRNALLNAQAEAIIVAGTTVTATNVTLAAGGRITGTITLTGGISYPEGQLELLHKTATGWQQVTATKLISGAQEYGLAGLPAGRYRLCIAAIECYANVAYDYDYERATELVVTAGQTISNINFVLGDGADRAGISGQTWGIDKTRYPISSYNSGVNRQNDRIRISMIKLRLRMRKGAIRSMVSCLGSTKSPFSIPPATMHRNIITRQPNGWPHNR